MNRPAAGETPRSNESGFYSLPSLAPGNYRITVRATGFETIVWEGIKLEVGDNVRLDFDLTIGDSRTVVTVNGVPPLMNTDDASVGTVIDRSIIDQMPLNGRGIQTLIELTPGVVATPVVPSSFGQFVVNGQRNDTSYFTVDGVSANFAALGANVSSVPAGVQTGSPGIPASNFLGTFSNLVSPDALQEFTHTDIDLRAGVWAFPGGANRNDHAFGDKPLHRISVRISSQRQDGCERLVRQRVRDRESATSLQQFRRNLRGPADHPRSLQRA